MLISLKFLIRLFLIYNLRFINFRIIINMNGLININKVFMNCELRGVTISVIKS